MSRFQWAVLQLSLQSLYHFKVSYEQNVAVAMLAYLFCLPTASRAKISWPQKLELTSLEESEAWLAFGRSTNSHAAAFVMVTKATNETLVCEPFSAVLSGLPFGPAH